MHSEWSCHLPAKNSVILMQVYYIYSALSSQAHVYFKHISLSTAKVTSKCITHKILIWFDVSRGVCTGMVWVLSPTGCWIAPTRQLLLMWMIRACCPLALSLAPPPFRSPCRRPLVSIKLSSLLLRLVWWKSSISLIFKAISSGCCWQVKSISMSYSIY